MKAEDFLKELEEQEGVPKETKKPSRFSENQRKILIAGIVIIFLMGLFPPWLYTFKRDSIYSENSAGYHFIIDGPKPKSLPYGIKIDFSRLFLQCLLVIVATGLGIFLFKRTDGEL